MSRRKKRRNPKGSLPVSGLGEQSIKNRQFSHLVRGCLSSLYNYSHTADMIRWTYDDSVASTYYSRLDHQWQELQERVKVLVRDQSFIRTDLDKIDPLSVFNAMTALYLTGYNEQASQCLSRLLNPVEEIEYQLAWSGHSRPVTTLIISLVNGHESFNLADFAYDPSIEDVRDLWYFESGIDLEAKHHLTLNSSPINEVCLLVLDKYEVDSKKAFPPNIAVPELEILNSYDSGQGSTFINNREEGIGNA